MGKIEEPNKKAPNAERWEPCAFWLGDKDSNLN